MDSNKRASSFVINRNDLITLFLFFFCNYSILDSIFNFFFLSRRGRSEDTYFYLFIYFVFFPRFDNRSNNYSQSVV